MYEDNAAKFLTYGYAIDALKFARFNCEQLSNIADIESMVWLSMVTSLVTHYGRPFKRAKGLLPVNQEFIPPESLDLHLRMLQARDKAHAHLDGDLSAIGDGSGLHQIRLLKQSDGKHFWCPTRVLLIKRRDIPSIALLIDSLLTRIKREAAMLERLLLPEIASLPSGIYLLSSTQPFLTPDQRNVGIGRLEEFGPIN